jgi:hypothetical protein
MNDATIAIDPASLKNAVLFNCCTNFTAPDWRQYRSLDLAGCHEVAEEGIVSGYSEDESDFFAVYAVLHDGCSDAITDVVAGASLDFAKDILRQLGEISGLPTTIHHALEIDQ